VRGVDTGHPALTAELPGGGWPAGALIELLAPQPGIGELRLLAPVLARAAGKPVVLIQPPHALQPLALAYWGIDPSGFVMLPAPRTADALWAAEQALRAGTCAAVCSGSRTSARTHCGAQSGRAERSGVVLPLPAGRRRATRRRRRCGSRWRRSATASTSRS
jgi:protein ImuA